MLDMISNCVSDNALNCCRQKLCKRSRTSSHMRTRLPKNNCVEKLSYFVKLQPGEWRQWTGVGEKRFHSHFSVTLQTLNDNLSLFCICYHLIFPISYDIAIKSSKTDFVK